MSSKFFTNSSDRSLFDKFKGIIENMNNLYAFHAVVGYFRSSGYFALQPYLKDLKDIKILVGINVDQMFAESQRKGLLYYGDVEKTKEEFLKWFIHKSIIVKASVWKATIIRRRVCILLPSVPKTGNTILVKS